jgi:hypothetical protein
MFMLKTKSGDLSTKIGAWSSLVVVGALLMGCQSSDPSPSGHPYVTTAPNCDNTVPLNHCGAYMPQYNPNNHS